MNDELRELLELMRSKGFDGERLAGTIMILFQDNTLSFEEFKELENEIGYNVYVSIEPNDGEDEEDEDGKVCIDSGDATLTICGSQEQNNDSAKNTK